MKTVQKNLLARSKPFVLSLASIFSYPFSNVTTAFAHEKTFPTKQLKAVTPDAENLTFKEANLKADASKIKEDEKKFGLTFSKGELAGSVFVGSGADKKPQLVAVFLDGKSERGSTEFGASVTTAGKLAKAKAFSSSESVESTSQPFLDSLVGKTSDELDVLRKSLGATDKSKEFIAELAEKAILRVSASFAKK